MSVFDFFIFGLYMAAVLGIGCYHFRRNKNADDYYVGNRNIHASHVGLSIVATDVGGGFSIGLGGLGFLMGLAGSWLLFTGLIGAWLSAVLIIPKIKKLDRKYGMMTYPDFLRWRYNDKVALTAALISGLGYMGFTGAQILAGAKLATGTVVDKAPFGLTPLQFSLLMIACITIIYTVIGGLKAVIYTDTVQWVILLCGLIFVTIPVTLWKIGGFARLRAELPAEFFSLTNVAPIEFINWMVTIIPIWLVGMTLYQRMYACKNEKEAKKAWFIAGFFEYPVMAFTGVFLGMCARVMFPQAESEMAMPMLIRDVLPVGVTGIVIAAYFSAIMSTADSCLMASSGNFVNDILHRYCFQNASEKAIMRLSQGVTLLIGVAAVVIAAGFEKVLDLIFDAYAFMVAGLFVPTLGAYFWKKSSSTGAFAAMLAGGFFTFGLLRGWMALPESVRQFDLHPSAYGIAASCVVFVIGSYLFPDRNDNSQKGEIGV
jgi:SSS family solute:Na+ symporter